MRVQKPSAALFATCTLLGAASAWAAPSVQGLKDLSIEELSNIEITSVSKRDEKLSDAPTSVFVITSEDIRRSGATRDCLQRRPLPRTSKSGRQSQGEPAGRVTI
jgi:outer membrane receptor for ferrienterochelin and colicin